MTHEAIMNESLSAERLTFDYSVRPPRSARDSRAQCSRSDAESARESRAVREENLIKQVRPVLSNFCCTFVAGKINVLVGPNGCGKSTLLKLLAGVLKPMSGRVMLGDANLATLPSRERARHIGLLFQENTTPADLSVRELVLEGRYPHLGFFAQPGADDRAKAKAALETCGLKDLADRPLDSLSSGQRRLAFIAMAVAQDPRWLLLDEPTTYLDIARELDILALVRRLNRELGISVVLSIHDLNAAASVADRIFAMKEGALVSSGTPAEVLTPSTLRIVFGAEATVLPDPTDGTPRIFWRSSEPR